MGDYLLISNLDYISKIEKLYMDKAQSSGVNPEDLWSSCLNSLAYYNYKYL